MNIKIQEKCFNDMDLRFYWVVDIFKQKHFGIFWKPGLRNLGGYFTKHQLPAHHKVMRYYIYTFLTSYRLMQGCVILS